jgi:hypothetical protein
MSRTAGDRAPQTVEEALSRFTEIVCQLAAACDLTPDMATCLLA